MVILKDDEEFGEGFRVSDQPVVIHEQVDTDKIAQQVSAFDIDHLILKTKNLLFKYEIILRIQLKAMLFNSFFFGYI